MSDNRESMPLLIQAAIDASAPDGCLNATGNQWFMQRISANLPKEGGRVVQKALISSERRDPGETVSIQVGVECGGWPIAIRMPNCAADDHPCSQDKCRFFGRTAWVEVLIK